ncbi:MAG: iron-containing redox enzyme family protein [Solirubrobacterales bacterium]
MAAKLWDQIEERRCTWNVLEHPFYQRWSAGELTREELSDYAGQYRHAVTALADMTAAAAAKSDGAANGLDAHAAEERAHIRLWDFFVAEFDGDVDAAPNPETAECVADWTAPADLATLLARMYAVESGQPEIARVKREGLAEFYGMDDRSQAEYFVVHEHLDVEHAAHARDLIDRTASPEQADELVDAAEAVFRANWTLLDGVGTTKAA